MRAILTLICAMMVALAAQAQTKEWTFDAKKFTEIHASFFYVKFTQGSTRSVKVRSKKEYADIVELKEDGNALVIGLKGKLKDGVDLQNPADVCIEVTSPKLLKVRCDGTAQLESGDIKTGDDFSLEVSGAGEAQFKKVQCGALSCLVTGVSRMDADRLECSGKADVKCEGAAQVNIRQVEATGMLGFDCTALVKYKGHLKASNMRSEITGAAKATLTVNARKLDMEVSGAAQLKMDFKGEDLNVGSMGATKLDLNVSCKKVFASNNGLSDFVISGTTDDIKVECVGASRINTTNLNRF